MRARVEGRSVADVLKENVPNVVKVGGKYFPSFQALIDDYKKNNPSDVIEEQNPYTDPTTNEADFYTIRVKRGIGKTFRQASKSAIGWQWKGLEGKLPLFNRIRVKDSEKVLVVEGEKCVREFTKLGMNIAATTSPGGASNAKKADWSILEGKTVYIWRDYDEPGLKYEQDVKEALAKIDCKVFRVRVEELDLDEKHDLVDYLRLNEGGTNADQVAAMNLIFLDAEPIGATSALEEHFEKITSGQFYAVPFLQKPKLTQQSKALMPGTLTTICGDPGAGKSFFVLEDAWRWCLQEQESVKVLMLEDDDAFHQKRALAQMSGYGDLTDVDYVMQNGDWAKSVYAEYRDNLERFAKHLETTNSEQWSLDQIAEWVRRHAENGVRIIIVDPITAAKVSDKPWIDDQKFLFTVKNVLEKTGASLILTTHPRLGQAGKPSLSGMAGGASYPRFSQCVLWLKYFEKEESNTLFGHREVRHKRSVEVRKARNGKGQGAHIAIDLNYQNLCFDEHGIIDPNATKEFH